MLFSLLSIIIIIMVLSFYWFKEIRPKGHIYEHIFKLIKFHCNSTKQRRKWFSFVAKIKYIIKWVHTNHIKPQQTAIQCMIVWLSKKHIKTYNDLTSSYHHHQHNHYHPLQNKANSLVCIQMKQEFRFQYKTKLLFPCFISNFP